MVNVFDGTTANRSGEKYFFLAPLRILFLSRASYYITTIRILGKCGYAYLQPAHASTKKSNCGWTRPYRHTQLNTLNKRILH